MPFDNQFFEDEVRGLEMAFRTDDKLAKLFDRMQLSFEKDFNNISEKFGVKKKEV